MAKSHRMKALAAVAVLGVGAVAVGCGSSSDTESSGKVGELKVGVLVPLTGDLSPFGGPNEKAAKLAGDTVNAAATSHVQLGCGARAANSDSLEGAIHSRATR